MLVNDESGAAVTQDETLETETPKRGSRKLLVLSIAASLLVALGCFIALALVPKPEGPPLKDPIRSLLTGVGVLGIAAPLCLGGAALKRRFEASPYFEGKFIATVLSVFGFACFAAGLACIILGAYDWIMPLLESNP